MTRAVGPVTVIGDLLEDIVVWVRGPVSPGTDNSATIRRSRGGSAANVAAAVAARGVPARFVGRVGADEAGAALVAQLAARGVDVRIQRAGRTGCVVVLVDEHGERTMFPDRAAAAELGPIDADDLDGSALVHVPLYGLADPAAAAPILAAVGVARRAGTRLSLDLSATSIVDRLGSHEVRSMLVDLRPDLVFATAAEAGCAGLTGGAQPPGVTLVIKDGAGPAVVVATDGARVLVPPGPVEAVRDTTGAGDAFAGAFLAAWVAGAAPGEAAAAGHALAAAVLGVAGADPHPSP